MNFFRCRTLRLAVSLPLLLPSLARADKWTAPTPEELSMTSQPQAPGAAAVYLFREETTDDRLHAFTVYVRLKVLTEAGKEFATVELPYYSASSGGVTVGDIAGRTIHPDGTVIPFKGKPYEKLIEKTQGTKIMAKVFSLPSVDVGSIIEYRYDTRYDDYSFIAPHWYIQSDLFTRKAHYNWKPTSEQLESNDDRGQLTNTISWTPILPPGSKLEQTRLPTAGGSNGQLIFDLNVHDVPAAPHEEFMPPIESLGYRLLFYYSPYRTGDEYWKKEGQHWAKVHDKFIGPGPKVAAAVQQIVSPTDTQEQKLKKIYAAVMQLENTAFTRQRSTSEEKAAGLNAAKNTDDILERKRGSDDQLAELFVAMARAAGMKAYLMAVTARDRSLFLQSFLSLSQLDDYVAIVNVDGKEHFFDPGQRYCPYGHLAWKHTFANGIRQIDGGSVLAGTSAEPYASSNTRRTADLRMDEHGAVTGTAKIIYTGAPALHWRQVALRGDSTSLERDLRVSAEDLLPHSLEVTVASVQKVADYEEPLTVTFNVTGGIGSATGKRLLILGDIFMSNSKATFPHEKRELPVCFQYPHMVQDAVRISFPASFSVESLPTAGKLNFLSSAAYALSAESTPTSFTVRRNYILGNLIFTPQEYLGLRTFYSGFENKDQENVILKIAAPITAANASPGY